MKFTHMIESKISPATSTCRNLAGMIFHKLDHRDERSFVILGHNDRRLLSISLEKYRSVVARLYMLFIEKGFKRGETVLLAGIPGNNECYISLLFSALASYGIRVFLPMFVENPELDQWIVTAGVRQIIIPGKEISALQHHEKEKALVTTIREKASYHRIPVYDSTTDFNLPALAEGPYAEITSGLTPLAEEALAKTGSDNEALIITTSGSSGEAQLVVYEQGAFIRSCLSWQGAGLFDEHRLGGRGFTPMFTHTIGIRNFFNALWSGHPVCLINTEWFLEKPEKVCSLLREMKPQHLTGGPGTFRLVLELMRNFPELKPDVMDHLKTIISTGARIDENVANEMESVFNCPVHNAFGTTETQQVLNTLLAGDNSVPGSLSMGEPLPGVKIGLQPYDKDHTYRLFVHSPFGCKYILTETSADQEKASFRYTGDIVRYENQQIVYYGREELDFFKDSFGVKIPLSRVRDFYAEMINECRHAEFFALAHEPGLAVILFVDKERTWTWYRQRLEKINGDLYRNIDPFTFRHYTLRRFTLVKEPPPLTRKGSIFYHKIRQDLAGLIGDLISVFPQRKNVRMLKFNDDSSDPVSLYLNSYIGRMLRQLKMDHTYHRGQKDSVFTFIDDKEVEILDMTGGYGTGLLGHNHPDLSKILIDFVNKGRISLSNQGSVQETAARLAERLNLIMGQITGKNFHVCFGSSGAEVVEMAIHHACLQWRQRFIRMEEQQSQSYGCEAGDLVKEVWEHNRKATETCKLRIVVSATAFHGHTSGARSLLADTEKRAMFSNILPIEPLYVDDRDPGWQYAFECSEKDAAMEWLSVVYQDNAYHVEKQKVSTIIAAIFEPIQGEGGIRALNTDFLKYFSGREYPLIMDEIQCGLGRSGHFTASREVDANYYLFAKALGGGFEKIGALLIESSCFQDKFNKFYSSTFANGEMAAAIATGVLDIILKDDVQRRARERGGLLRQRLEELKSNYPGVIREISGRGLILGVCFSDLPASDNIILRLLIQKKMLGYLFASYLLYHHAVRILPSLVASNVLRIEPSVYLTNAEIDHFVKAMTDLAETIHGKQLYKLFRHLTDEDDFGEGGIKTPAHGFFYQKTDRAKADAVKVTFIGHFAYPVDELRAFEKKFCQVSDTGLRILSNRFQSLFEMDPVILFEKNIFNQRIHFTCMIIPLDSAELERLHREGNRRKITGKIQKAVDLAAAKGSRIISLGGYMSILSNNGLALTAPDRVKVITGNTLTVASGLHRLINTLKEAPWCKKNVVAVVGIPGNIGSTLAARLVQRDDLFSEVILVGRKLHQVEHFMNILRQEVEIPGGMIVKPESDLRCLQRCDVIVNSTNTNDPVIFPHHIKKNANVLISDNSVPAGISKEVIKLSNVKSLPFASYIRLPYDPDFVISSYTPQGSVFCCAGEAILCGLEEINLPLRGKISLAAVDEISRLAEKNRLFEKMGDVAGFKSFVQ